MWDMLDPYEKMSVMGINNDSSNFVCENIGAHGKITGRLPSSLSGIFNLKKTEISEQDKDSSDDLIDRIKEETQEYSKLLEKTQQLLEYQTTQFSLVAEKAQEEIGESLICSENGVNDFKNFLQELCSTQQEPISISQDNTKKGLIFETNDTKALSHLAKHVLSRKLSELIEENQSYLTGNQIEKGIKEAGKLILEQLKNEVAKDKWYKQFVTVVFSQKSFNILIKEFEKASLEISKEFKKAKDHG